jgi:hypothetical protein
MKKVEVVLQCALTIFLIAACSREPRSMLNGTPAPAAKSPADSNPGCVLVTNETQAKAAIGKRVRVQGIAERLKLGDTVASEGLGVICLDQRFPDSRLNRPITVEGVLELTDAFAATVDEYGGITQGTEPGSWAYFINACTVL